MTVRLRRRTWPGRVTGSQAGQRRQARLSRGPARDSAGWSAEAELGPMGHLAQHGVRAEPVGSLPAAGIFYGKGRHGTMKMQ